MRASYEREMNRNWLILEEEQQEISGYTVRILEGNILPSVLPLRMEQVDSQIRFCYDTTSRQPLAEVIRKEKISGTLIRMIMESTLRVVQEMHDYLLDIDQLLLQPDYIFTAAGERRLYFCCLPGNKKDFKSQMAALLESLLPLLDHEDAEAVAVGYHCYRDVAGDTFSFEGIRRTLYSIPVGISEPYEDEAWRWEQEGIPPAEEEAVMDVFLGPEEPKPVRRRHSLARMIVLLVCFLLLSMICAALYKGLLPRIPLTVILTILTALTAAGMVPGLIMSRWKNRKNRSGTEDVPEIPGEEMTEMSGLPLSQEISPEENDLTEIAGVRMQGKGNRPCLRAIQTGLEDIFLDRDSLVLGKLPAMADKVIPCRTVSRVHAKICRREDAFMIWDLNSRNGTYVNDRLLQQGEEHKLLPGDVVRFAEVSYVYEP